MGIYHYEVRQRILPPGPDGVTFDLSDAGATLLIQLSKPTAAEKKSFHSGISIQFSVVEQIIFVLCRMGALQWMDAPYYKFLSKSLSHFEYPDEEQGLSIHALLVDGATGVLVAQKILSPPTELSRALLMAIAVQPKIEDYSARLSRVMSQYSTQDLLTEAQKIC